MKFKILIVALNFIFMEIKVYFLEKLFIFKESIIIFMVYLNFILISKIFNPG